MDENIASFTAITSASPEQAQVYLQLADNNLEQAVILFFENPGLAAESTTVPQSTRPEAGTSSENAIRIDSDNDSDVEMLEAVANTTDDAEMARRLQEEMYGDSGVQSDGEDTRAPMARTRETLIGGAGEYEDLDDDTISSMVQQQLLGRRGRRTTGRIGIFNQSDRQADLWNNDEQSSSSNPNILSDSGNTSDRPSKASTLAEMYRPPFEIIYRGTLEQARDEGKEKLKWLIVNVQDSSIFDCQLLNRDLWKNKAVMETIKEHFFFLQYGKQDPRGESYINYYFMNSLHDENAYPHIAILDPRTGEQVKLWSGRPVPKADDFVQQLYDFLDRYSLDDDARNPVAKRKPERKPTKEIDRMTEEEMMEMALKNSLDSGANDEAGGPTQDDPDDLTRSLVLDKGKGIANDTNGKSNLSPFDRISSDNPHEEPPNDPSTTTRIQFRYSGGRVVRRFSFDDKLIRIYEWLKAAPLEGKEGKEFDLIFMGRNLIASLEQTILEAGLKNGSIMVEFSAGED